MRELLTPLVTANLAAAAAIVLVALLRKRVRSVFGARIAYALWWLVPLAVAASLAPPRPAEMAPALPIAPAGMVTAAEDAFAWFWTGGPADTATITTPGGLPLGNMAVSLWLAGALLMIAWLAVRQWQFAKARRRGEAGPAVVGFLKPKIIVPSDFEARFDRRERAVVLAHEAVHLARHDARLNALVALARCVCWFNPLVHLAAHLMRIDQEMACDAAVVERHPRARGAYAQALLKAQLSARPLPLGCYWPAGTEHPLMERIAMLTKSKPTLARRATGALLVTLLGAAGGYAAWAANPSDAVHQGAAMVIAAEPAQAQPAAPRAASRRTAAQDEGETAAAPAEVCLTNACAEAPAAVAGAPERFTQVGAAKLPVGFRFVSYFDESAPMRVRGRITDVRMTDGVAAEMMVQGEDGKLYRVIGGDPAKLPADMRAAFQDMVGNPVNVRGYLAYDQSCEGGCLANGNDVTFPDGGPAALKGRPAAAWRSSDRLLNPARP